MQHVGAEEAGPLPQIPDLPESRSFPTERQNSETPLPAVANGALYPQEVATATGDEDTPLGTRGDYPQGLSQVIDNEGGFSGNENVTPTILTNTRPQRHEVHPDEGSAQPEYDSQGTSEKTVSFVEQGPGPDFQAQHHSPGASHRLTEKDSPYSAKQQRESSLFNVPSEGTSSKESGQHSEVLAELRGQGAVTLPPEEVPSLTSDNFYPQLARLVSREPEDWLAAGDNLDDQEATAAVKLKEPEETVSLAPTGGPATAETLLEPQGPQEVASHGESSHFELHTTGYGASATLPEAVSTVGHDDLVYQQHGATAGPPVHSEPYRYSSTWLIPDKDAEVLTWPTNKEEDQTPQTSLDQEVSLLLQGMSETSSPQQPGDLSPSLGPFAQPSKEAVGTRQDDTDYLPVTPGELQGFMPMEADSGSGEERGEAFAAEAVESLVWTEEANGSSLGKVSPYPNLATTSVFQSEIK